MFLREGRAGNRGYIPGQGCHISQLIINKVEKLHSFALIWSEIFMGFIITWKSDLKVPLEVGISCQKLGATSTTLTIQHGCPVYQQ